MKKKIQLISVIALLLALAPQISAQITIGNSSEPAKGALLQVKESDNIGANSSKGFGMPRVQLTALNHLYPTIDTHVASTQENMHIGLTVFNVAKGGDEINGYFCPGLYVWTGMNWQKVGSEECPTPPRIIVHPADFTHIVIIDNAYDNLKVEAIGQDLTYTWKDGKGNVVGTNNPYFYPPRAYGYEEYTCTVSNEVGQAVSTKGNVLFGCGARTVSGDWLVLRCHNLGADESLPPFEHNPGLYGDLYQWGRKADGHEKRNSDTTHVRSATITPNHPKFIITKDAPYEWLDAPDIVPRWGDGTQNVDQAKGVNDPCPAGWKIPTEKQWDSIFNGDSDDSATPESATANTWVQVDGKGFKVGVGLYFPTYGGFTRTATTGIIHNLTMDWGSYWASNAITDPDHRPYIFISGNYITPDGHSREAIGHGIRCMLDQ